MKKIRIKIKEVGLAINDVYWSKKDIEKLRDHLNKTGLVAGRYGHDIIFTPGMDKSKTVNKYRNDYKIIWTDFDIADDGKLYGHADILDEQVVKLYNELPSVVKTSYLTVFRKDKKKRTRITRGTFDVITLNLSFDPLDSKKHKLKSINYH